MVGTNGRYLPTRMKRKQLLTIAVWLAAMALLWAAIRTVPITAVFDILRHLQWWQFAALTLLNGGILIFLTARWWLILWGMGYKLPFLMTMGHRLASFGVSYFTPGPQFGGEVVQVLLAEKGHGMPRTTAVSSVALDKSIELLVNFSFLALGVMVVLRSNALGDGADGGWKTAVLALALLALPLLYLAAIWRGYHPLAGFVRQFRPLFRRRESWACMFETAVSALANSEEQAGDFCHHAPRFLWASLFVSVLGWVAMVVEFGATLTFLGADASALQVIMVLTAVRIAFLLPSPGGLGAVEAAQVMALTQLGLDPAIGLSTSVLLHGRDVFLGLIGLWWGKHFMSKYALPKETVNSQQSTKN